MVEVVVFCEGQTEEQFIKRVVAPAFRAAKIFVKAQTLRTSQESRGGAVSFDRLKFYARNALLQNSSGVLSTFLDLYALDTSFPSFEEAKQLSDIYAKTTHLEAALHDAIIEYAGCRSDRFIPHIQPHEFEGLLFSDVGALVSIEPGWGLSGKELAKIVASHDSPEHINDGYETKPSYRLETMLDPRYRKTRHGPLAAERITLSVMEEKCLHFRGWVDRLRTLAASS